MIKIADLFYTEVQAARLLGVNRITIWRWIKEGRFNVQRVGRVVFIPKSDVEELINRGGKWKAICHNT